MKNQIKDELETIRQHFTDDLYNKYINGEITFSKMALLLGVYSYRLQRYFDMNHIKYREHVLQETTDHTFFQNIDSEIKAYLLGFYLADGSLSNKSNRIKISVNKCDEYIIDLFKKHISPHYKKCETKSFKNKKTGYITKPMVNISITSKTICESLTMYGMGEHKTDSEVINIDCVDDDMFIHFLRGYFDGDGTVCCTNGKRLYKGKMYFYRNFNWSIISNKKQHLEKIQERLHRLYNIHANLLCDTRGHFLLEINRKYDFFKMRDVLYDNANYFLLRKKEKYMAIPC